MHAKRSLAWSIILLAPYFALSAPVPAGDVMVTAELVAGNLDLPVFLTHAPGDFDRLFVVEQGGLIRIITDGIVLAEPFLDLTDVVNSSLPAWGLMAVAFHPDYQKNGFFYVLYTGGVVPESESIIARYQVSADPAIGDPDSGQLVVNVWSAVSQHHGNWIGFGPNDGYLYFSHGFGAGDNAQNLNSLLGKILRLDVNGDDFPDDPDRNYAIPPTNPFVGKDGADEVWAYGIRQPWRCSFDRQTGDLYFGDVGASSWEEINFQPASSPGGENYGWNCKEGTHCTSSKSCDCADPTLVDPIFEYENPPDDQAVVIGGYVYRGCAIPDLDGAYIFLDYFAVRIWLLRHEDGEIIELQEIQDQLDLPGNKYSSFGEDAFGELYICKRQGRIYRIIPTGPVDPDCNNNGVADACDIAAGTSMDTNGNGIPDECECMWDLDGTGDVGVKDLLILLGAWGPNPGHPADFDGDGNVGVPDLLALFANWGPCP
ncbi:MAG: PQQ-dependent sugar dehydrogenase [Planctomycetes bacterium]|nr:PQQ-dependent sugar dehydrogenase [Planctomycetota bacterium]